MKKVVIGIGSNVELRDKRVEDAISFLETQFTDTKASVAYNTLPEGNALHQYTNAVLEGLTEMSEAEVSAMLKEYELTNGRTPELKAQDIVTIDLDLTVYDDKILRPDDFKSLYFTIGYNQIKNAER
ncbi:MAG: 2-amino-4-hydroxy-6-hydroxymethyldihydropteridine diphosphokinase [Muribaculaceae bacterium]|nr:2-amino-4-hydroxy-6-hydroxymethyldihydropteridine diphosphokinase [Muribaculaceae bacterium]